MLATTPFGMGMDHWWSSGKRQKLLESHSRLLITIHIARVSFMIMGWPNQYGVLFSQGFARFYCLPAYVDLDGKWCGQNYHDNVTFRLSKAVSTRQIWYWSGVLHKCYRSCPSQMKWVVLWLRTIITSYNSCHPIHQRQWRMLWSNWMPALHLE